MKRLRFWRRVWATGFGSHARFGRVAKAFRHTSGAVLTLHRPCSRGSAFYTRIGIWVIRVDEQELTHRMVYNRPVRGTPTRWATQVLRQQLGEMYGRLCRGAELHDILPNCRPARQSEPVSIPPIILGVPRKPPRGLLRGKHAEQVLFDDEMGIYAEVWQAMAGRIQEITPESRRHLHDVAQAEVLQYRLLKIMKHSMDPELSSLLSRSARKQQRARLANGLTRRQRMEVQERQMIIAA